MEPCGFEVGECLLNQPYDLWAEDNGREANGLVPLYKAQRFSQSGDMSLHLMLQGPGTGRYIALQYKVPEMSLAILMLEISADNLNFIERFPPGEVCADCETICFEASSSQALLCCCNAAHDYCTGFFIQYLCCANISCGRIAVIHA